MDFSFNEVHTEFVEVSNDLSAGLVTLVPFWKNTIRISALLRGVFLSSILFTSTVYAVGNATTGSTTWTTYCTSCHGSPKTTGGAFTLYGGATVNSLSAYANNAAAITYAASTGYSPIPAGNTYPGAAGGNTSTFMSGYLAILNTVSPSGFTNAQDISAYFASQFTPVVTNPGPSTSASGAAYSYQITGSYLVSSTVYSASATGLALSVNPSGLVTATLPNNLSAPQTYAVTLSAQNGALTGTAGFNLTVNPPAPVISSAGTASAAVGVNATLYTITASNSPTGYSLWAGALPTGTSLTGANVSGTPTTAGTFNVTLAATNAGGTVTKAVAFTIAKGSQTISFGAAPTVLFNGTGTAAATATSGLAVSYAASGGCAVNASSGLVTGTAAGTNNCVITASQGGNANYNAATNVTQTFSIGKANQSISFGAAPAVSFNGTGTASATATSGLAVSYAASGGCTVNASTGVVTGSAAGNNNCVITANQGGNTDYNAASQVTQTLSIGKANQAITFGAAPTVLVGNSGAVTASGGGSGNAVVFTSLTSSICSTSGTNGSTVNGLAFGTCTIAANQSSGINHNAASQVTQDISVGLTAQNIIFGSAPSLVYGGGTGTVSASGGGSGNAVVFTVPITTSICSISGGVVTPLAAGTCTVAANQLGNVAYSPASEVTLNIPIDKAVQSITFGSAPSVVVGGLGTVSATGGASGNPVTFSTTTASICTISSATVTGVSTGSCVIRADQAVSANYKAATAVTQTISVGQGSQSISFGAAPAIIVGGTGVVSATGGASGNAVIFTVPVTTSICSVSGSTVTGITAGTCTVVANQSANANYTAAPQKTQSFSIGKAGQSIAFGVAPTLAVGGTGSVSATSTSTLAVAYSSASPSICTISGSIVTALAVGTCVISANQSGDANYNPAMTVSQNIGIGQGSQTISLGVVPSVSVGGTGSLSATATSGLTVTYSSLTASICTVSGNTVTGVVAGTCTIAANQVGDANYTSAAQVSMNFNISNLPPAVSVASVTTQLNTTATFDLSPFITGTGVSGVNISAVPAHGTANVSGTRVVYTPAKDYFGTDTFSYQAYGLAGVSPTSAIVTVTITGRPDPIKDARVTGLVNIETTAVKRFGKAQVFNFQQRLESRHHAAFSGANSVRQGGGVQTSPSTGGPAPEANRSYFNSWQPGTILAYANDPNTLLNAPDQRAESRDTTYDPLTGMLANVLIGGLTSDSLNLATVSNAVGAMQEESFGRLEVWAAGNLRFGTRSQSGVDTRFSTDGISIGVDKRIDRKLTMGMGFGFARDKSSVGTDGTNSTSNGTSMAGYASYQMDAGTFTDVLLGIGKVNFDTNRYVTSVSDFARATRTGSQVFGSLSFGYEYRNDGVLWSPYGRYDFSLDHLNAGTETGAGANALNYAKQDSRNSQLAFGMRAQSVHQTSFGVVQPHARFEYQRSIESNGQTYVSYADLLGTQYTVASTTLNKNSVVLGLGSEFLLSDTLRFVLDYQHLGSGGQENYQSISFRVTKDLNGKNDLDALLAESYESSSKRPAGLMVAAGFAYDDNVTRASEALDKLSDTLYSLTLSKAKSFNLTPHTRLAVSGFLDMEKFRTYTGLGHVSVGGQAEYQYRFSGEFGSPTLGIFARMTADEYESALRDGSRSSFGFTLRKPVTDRINLFSAVARNARNGRSAVFNTQDNSIRANLDYALSADQTVYLGGEYRVGDIVSTGQPSLAILDIATVFVRDDVFSSPWMYDYRMKGKTALMSLGYNYSFGTRDSIDVSWRHVQSKPDKSPSFSAPSISYTDNQISISYLMAF